VLTIIFTILSALYDNGKRFINHTPRFIFRAVVVAIISYLESGNFLINYIQNAAVFYLLFDYMLNILEGRKWNYIGGTAEWDISRRQIEVFAPYFDLITKIMLVILAFNLHLLYKWAIKIYYIF
jgi:hypothetical protein